MSMHKGRLAVLVLSLIIALLLPLAVQSFYVSVATRICIFAIAALGLDLVLGYAGLVSFGHAAFLATGAYVTGMLALQGVTSAGVVWPAAVAASTAVALIVGALSLRTAGLYFIMVTLAFAQMVFYFFQSLRRYGGDDGFRFAKRNDFFGWIDLSSPAAFYYLVLAILGVVTLLVWRIVNSPFGKVIQGGRDNERRLAAIGFSPFPYKLVAFGISGALTGLAGVLLANNSLFVSPQLGSWMVSGELLVMIILGGSGSLFGPIAGAILYIVLEEMLSGYTTHWPAALGVLLILRVLLLPHGFFERRAAAGGA
jgi:branched-chain amino acid transport system permease protein